MREEVDLRGGGLPSFFSQWTFAIRNIVDDISKRELKDYPRMLETLRDAVQRASVQDVAQCERKLVELFEHLLKDLENIRRNSLRVEYRVAHEIDEILGRLDRMRSKAPLRDIVPEISNMVAKVQSLVTKTKDMWERSGDYVQNIQTRNLNLAGQFGAERKLLDPMFMLGRQQRQLTKVVLDLAQTVEDSEIKINDAEQRKDGVALRKHTLEMKKSMSEFDSKLSDEFGALTGIRLFSLYVTMVVSTHLHQELTKLELLLKQAGFPQEKGQELVRQYQNLIQWHENTTVRLMRLEESCFQQVSKVFEHLQKDVAELQRAT